MRFAIALTVFFACGSLAAQSAVTTRSGVPRVEGLNFAQQKAVEEYVLQNERPTGELRWVADRRMRVFTSEAPRTLFPNFRFLAIQWITEADPAVLHKYSIPGPIVETLVLDEDGGNCMPNRTGDRKEFGDLLRTEHVKITGATSAAMVRSALSAIDVGWGTDDLRTNDLRHENSNWLLGYREWPFRAISSYEEVREASYYLISVDKNGFVVSGRSVREVLERRKLNGDGSNR